METPTRPSAARARLMQAALEVFYVEGVRAVGVERVIERAQVTRATFYRHFPTKEALVVAYLEELDRAVREHVGPVPEDRAGAVRWLRSFTGDIGSQLCRHHFRGCAFINAAAEYPAAEHPVRLAVAAHRTWMEESVRTALTRAGHPDPADGARRWLALRDGAMVAGYLGVPDAAATTLTAAVEDLVPVG